MEDLQNKTLDELEVLKRGVLRDSNLVISSDSKKFLQSCIDKINLFINERLYELVINKLINNFLKEII